MSQNTVSIQLDIEDSRDLKEVLLANGWEESSVNNEYVSLRMKNRRGSVCTLYTSKKFVLQGNEDFTETISLVKEGCGGVQQEYISPHIGVDEVGKGDYFGPLVVVACFVNNDIKKRLSCLGVGDSKKFSDQRILKMYDSLKSYEYYYSSVVSPSEYNELYKQYRNVSILLAKQHSKVIEMGLSDLKSKGIQCDFVVIDQFSSKKSRVVNELGDFGKKIDFRQFHKGESDIAVATASVIARGIFLNEMESMGKEYYFNFPKGASNVVDSAREFVKKHGMEELEKVAKISFKTTAQVMQSSF